MLTHTMRKAKAKRTTFFSRKRKGTFFVCMQSYDNANICSSILNFSSVFYFMNTEHILKDGNCIFFSQLSKFFLSVYRFFFGKIVVDYYPAFEID